MITIKLSYGSGLQKLPLAWALQKYADMRLYDAKKSVDKILDGQTVAIKVKDLKNAGELIRLAIEYHAKVDQKSSKLVYA